MSKSSVCIQVRVIIQMIKVRVYILCSWKMSEGRVRVLGRHKGN